MSSDDDIVFQPRTEAIYKIVVLGDPSVGKTSLLNKFSTKKFKSQYIPTVGVNILKEVVTLNIDGEEVIVNLMLWDVAGQPQFYMLHKPYFNGGDGMIIVFDTTRQSTFSNVKNWWNTCVKHGLSSVPRILVGNKIDLKDERKIMQPHADHLSQEISAPYFETSAKTGINVDLIFKNIAERTFRNKRKG